MRSSLKSKKPYMFVWTRCFDLLQPVLFRHDTQIFTHMYFYIIRTSSFARSGTHTKFRPLVRPPRGWSVGPQQNYLQLYHVMAKKETKWSTRWLCPVSLRQKYPQL